MADDLLSVLLTEMPGWEALGRADQALWLKRAKLVPFVWPDDARRLLAAIGELPENQVASWDEPLAALMTLISPHGAHSPAAWSAELLAVAEAAAGKLADAPASRAELLAALARSDDPAALGLFVTLLERHPPTDEQHVNAVLVPLFQPRAYDPGALFPELLNLLAQPAMAAGVLDLANFLFRTGRATRHPAAARSEQLIALLGQIAQHLQRIEEQPGPTPEERRSALRAFQESTSLVVSLCDALALIGSKEAIGKLNQVLELRHRRLRTEAACALARLGEKSGVKALVELTKEPVVRGRALVYLDEVGALDEAPAETRTSAARAEGDLAAWLAEPTQFGLAPQGMELLESQTLYWPGYDEPIECHLFEFEYVLPQTSFSGIGLAGPITHVFGVDLQDYPPADIFAMYCGWHAEHRELKEIQEKNLTPAQRVAVDRWRRKLHELGYLDIVFAKAALFFGEQHYVFEAEKVDGDAHTPGVIVVDGDTLHWYRQPATSRPPGEREIYWLHRGRKLLTHFNPKTA